MSRDGLIRQAPDLVSETVALDDLQDLQGTPLPRTVEFVAPVLTAEPKPYPFAARVDPVEGRLGDRTVIESVFSRPVMLRELIVWLRPRLSGEVGHAQVRVWAQDDLILLSQFAKTYRSSGMGVDGTYGALFRWSLPRELAREVKIGVDFFSGTVLQMSILGDVDLE